MPVFSRIVLCAAPLAGLVRLAHNPYSHSAVGVSQVLLFSLFMCLAFAMRQRALRGGANPGLCDSISA